MKKLLLIAGLLTLAGPAMGQTSNVRIVGNDSTGNPRPVLVTDDGRLQVAGAGGGTAAAPSSTVTTVQGTSASGAADAGNPVKIGGVYNNAALPALTTGARADLPTTNGGVPYFSLSGLAGTAADGLSNTTVIFPSSAIGGNNPATARTGLATSGYVFNGTSWDRQRGDTNGTWMVQKGGSNLATAQVSVGTTSTLVAAARTGRQRITVAVGAANTCAFGNTGVTTTTGFALQPTAGASLTLDTNAALYAACSATTTVNVLEQY